MLIINKKDPIFPFSRKSWDVNCSEYLLLSGNFVCFVVCHCRCHRKAEIGVHFEQRCCSPPYHFISLGGSQSKHFSIPCSWSWCGIWKSYVCLSGNGLWGNGDCDFAFYLDFFQSPVCFHSIFFFSLCVS